MADKGAYLKNFLIGYLAAALSVLLMFLVTMRVHYRAFDFDYLIYALKHIIWLAIPSGILGAIFYKKTLLIKIVAGGVIGPMTAAVFIFMK